MVDEQVLHTVHFLIINAGTGMRLLCTFVGKQGVHMFLCTFHEHHHPHLNFEFERRVTQPYGCVSRPEGCSACILGPAWADGLIT